MRTLADMTRDCIRRLNDSGIAYMITGSTAGNRWGVPRSTHDVDVVVQFSPPEVPKVVAAFESEYFIQEISVRSIFRPPHQFNAIDNESGGKIDFWLLAQSPYEQQAFRRRRQEWILGEPAYVATAEDVILSKLRWCKLSHSDRQLDDVAGIVAVQGETLDQSYLRRWAKEIGVEDTLEKAFDGTIRPKST